MNKQEATQYATHIEASEEVLHWIDTVLASVEKAVGRLDQTEVEHILDYLVSPAAPARLRKMSYVQAKASATKWSEANQKKGRDIVDSPEDIRVLHDFGDGTRIVQLLTPSAYKREGFFMSHCVGSYSPASSTIYSYRDAQNIPHATFEVAKDGKQIMQIKGKGNGAIHPKYIQPILTFLQILGITVRPSEMTNLGYLHIKPEILDSILLQFEFPTPPKLVHILGNQYVYTGVAG